MSRSGALITLGLLTMLAPFSGLPSSIRSFLALLFGACVVGIGIFVRAEQARASEKEVPAPSAQTEVPTPHSMSAI